MSQLVNQIEGYHKNFFLLGKQCELSPRGWRGGGEVLPYICHIGMCRPKGWGFGPFLSENGYRLGPFWTGVRVWFSRELQECMNVVLFSFPNDKEHIRLRSFAVSCG